MVPPANTTGIITFSADSNLAIVETNHYNPITIIDITTYEVVNTISINDIILEAHFQDANNSLLVVFCQNAFIVVDLIRNKQFSMPPILATSYAADQNNNIFTCVNNNLVQQAVEFTRTIDESAFYMPIELPSTEESIFDF